MGRLLIHQLALKEDLFWRILQMFRLIVFFSIANWGFWQQIDESCASVSASSVIEKAVFNLYPPERRVLDIKNVDYVRVTTVNGTHQTSLYRLDVYIWLQEAVGLETSSLKVYEAEGQAVQLTVQLPEFVGRDEATGYYVYRVQMHAPAPPVSLALSAEFHYQSQVFRSQQGPDVSSWFWVHYP